MARIWPETTADDARDDGAPLIDKQPLPAVNGQLAHSAAILIMLAASLSNRNASGLSLASSSSAATGAPPSTTDVAGATGAFAVPGTQGYGSSVSGVGGQSSSFETYGVYDNDSDGEVEDGYAGDVAGGDLDDIYDIVDTVVLRVDDVNTPVLTFRVWVIGSFFTVLLAIMNTVFSFRTNFFTINPFIALLVSYPLGQFFARVLPTRRFRIPFIHWSYTLNPGQFSHKEHAMVYIFAANGSLTAYGLYNVVCQRYLLGQDVSVGMCVMFVVATQCVGIGLAGLCRKFLVRPAAMLWPTTLSVIALVRSVHDSTFASIADDDDDDDDGAGTGGRSGMSSAASLRVGSRHASDIELSAASEVSESKAARAVFAPGSPRDSAKLGRPGTAPSPARRTRRWSRSKFFWVAAGAMALYQFVPSFVAPVLSAVSLLCYVAPGNQRALMLGSARQGVGMLSLTFDWSVMSQMAPIISPLWTLWNQYVGVWIILWVVVPAMWATNAFGIDQQLGTSPSQGPNGTGAFPLGQALNSNQLFNNKGVYIPTSALSVVANGTVVLNEKVYEANKPIYVTTYMAIEYMMAFVVYSAAITHVILWYGQDLWYRLKTSMQSLDTNDIHATLMDRYQDVPNSWYLVVLFVSIILVAIAGSSGGFELSWWAVLLSLAVVVVSIIPAGIITAISGQRLVTNVISEVLIGFILPGQPVAVMSFKSLTYSMSYQAITFSELLKFGHYVKFPPRATFTVQIFTVVLAAVINVLAAVFVYEMIGVDVMNNNPPAGWT
ncbi:hypothetical protein HK405_007049, partial [Cladochytrium tenue]